MTSQLKNILKENLPLPVVNFVRKIKSQFNKLTLESQQQPKRISLPKRYANTSLAMVVPPQISIVTPSYNQACYIERTIKSVLTQQYPKLEYIVQDGASSDGTDKVLDDYRDQISQVYSEVDTGQANAINKGFARTTGEIMAWLNSDDLLLPGSLTYVANYFYANPTVDVVYGHRLLIDSADDVTGRWVLPPHSNSVMKWVDYVPQETMFWRRSIWDKTGGTLNESFRYALDWDLILRFQEAGANIVRLPRFIGAFRVHPAQKTSAWHEIGQAELKKLHKRSHRRTITPEEIAQATRPYLRKALLYHYLYRANILRY